MMLPGDFTTFFLASAGAGAALVGLLFVAISISPERTLHHEAPAERQALATCAFTAMVNAFLISLAGLLPTGIARGSASPNPVLVAAVLVLGLAGLYDTARVGLVLRHGRPGLLHLVRRMSLVVSGLFLYGAELYYGYGLLHRPGDPAPLYSLGQLLVLIYTLGLLRAWELLGARRYGIAGWLSLLRELDEPPTATPEKAPARAPEPHAEPRQTRRSDLALAATTADRTSTNP